MNKTNKKRKFHINKDEDDFTDPTEIKATTKC